jgi:hypothetical protein
MSTETTQQQWQTVRLAWKRTSEDIAKSTVAEVKHLHKSTLASAVADMTAHGYVYIPQYLTTIEKLGFVADAYEFPQQTGARSNKTGRAAARARMRESVSNLLDGTDRETGTPIQPAVSLYAPFLAAFIEEDELVQLCITLFHGLHPPCKGIISASSAAAAPSLECVPVIHHDHCYVRVKNQETLVHADLGFFLQSLQHSSAEVIRSVLRHAAKSAPTSTTDAGLQHNIGMYTCWVTLTECSPVTGGLILAHGSHRVPRHEHMRHDVDVSQADSLIPVSIQQSISELDWRGAAFKPGDVLVFDSRTVHAAAARTNSLQRRVSLDFRFMSNRLVLSDEVASAASIPTIHDKACLLWMSYKELWVDHPQLLATLTFHDLAVNLFLLRQLPWASGKLAPLQPHITQLIALTHAAAVKRAGSKGKALDGDAFTFGILKRCGFSDLAESVKVTPPKNTLDRYFGGPAAATTPSDLSTTLAAFYETWGAGPAARCGPAALVESARDMCSAMVHEWMVKGIGSKSLQQCLDRITSITEAWLRTDYADDSHRRFMLSVEQRSVPIYVLEQYCYLLTHVVLVQTDYAAASVSQGNIRGLDVVCNFLTRCLTWIVRADDQHTELLTECITVFTYHADYQGAVWEMWFNVLQARALKPPPKVGSARPTHATAYAVTHLSLTLAQALTRLCA